MNSWGFSPLIEIRSVNPEDPKSLWDFQQSSACMVAVPSIFTRVSSRSKQWRMWKHRSNLLILQLTLSCWLAWRVSHFPGGILLEGKAGCRLCHWYKSFPASACRDQALQAECSGCIATSLVVRSSQGSHEVWERWRSLKAWSDPWKTGWASAIKSDAQASSSEPHSSGCFWHMPAC